MKDNMEFEVQDIKDLMEAMKKNKVSLLEIGSGDYSLKLESARETPVYTAAAPAPVYVERPAMDDEEPDAPRGNVIKSPIVGTFYAAPAPDKEAFVKAGDRVSKGDVLFIIESMKLMNEVTSDYDGVVAQILVENGQAVEYGQPILTIE